MEALSNYYKIVKCNIKLLRVPIGISLIYVLLSKLFFDFKMQNASYVSSFCEMYLSVVGIFIYNGLIMLEEENRIQEICYIKPISQFKIVIIRVGIMIFTNILLFGLILAYVKYEQAQIRIIYFLVGALITALFLGTIEMTVSTIFKNNILGLCCSIFIYIINFFGGEKLLGKLYLFTLINNHYERKLIFLIISIVLLAANVLYLKKKF